MTDQRVFFQEAETTSNILENVSVLFASAKIKVSKAWGDTGIPLGGSVPASVMLIPPATSETLSWLLIKSPMLTYIATVDLMVVEPQVVPIAPTNGHYVELRVQSKSYLLHFPNRRQYAYFCRSYSSSRTSVRSEAITLNTLSTAWATFDVPFEFPPVTTNSERYRKGKSTTTSFMGNGYVSDTDKVTEGDTDTDGWLSPPKA
ncbi:hypothetical protein BV22DRAFT_1134172 [Leucogyrophana mollusca]|uniref:Uncharacterized protein n=1 Tax=Leucogyrophana mollusca TaxID=85980 RepID=A0ACB8AZJ7_9AGAM|nr:hypothetical protein BV22DRAFT_1134172 [Leucogyrophana mollusca]